MKDSLTEALETLRNGGVIVYPTDTAYGLGVDATNTDAVERLFDLKGRGATKAIHVTVSDMAMAEAYAEITDSARKLAEAFLPGPLTLVLKKKETVSDLLVGGKNTVGIRIPNNTTALEIVRAFDKPITATSANISGDTTPYSIPDVRNSFGADFETLTCIDAGTLPHVLPSTLLDLTTSTPTILREGPITREDILSVLG